MRKQKPSSVSKVKKRRDFFLEEMLHLVKASAPDVTDSRSFPTSDGKSRGFKKNHTILTPSAFAKGLCLQLFVLCEDTNPIQYRPDLKPLSVTEK